MNPLPLEPYDRHSYLAWVAHFKAMRSAAPAPCDDVPRRSEAFAEDVENLAPAATAVAAASCSGCPAPTLPAANADLARVAA